MFDFFENELLKCEEGKKLMPIDIINNAKKKYNMNCNFQCCDKIHMMTTMIDCECNKRELLAEIGEAFVYAVQSGRLK